jgi:selenocysteine-specific elongation factor
VEQALAERKLERQGDLFRHKSFKGSLSNEDRKLIGIIEERLQTSGFSAPLASGMAEELGKPRKRIDNLLVLLEGAGRAVRLEDGLYVHMDSVKGARDKLVSYCLQNEEMPSNVMKDVIGASRKYVIPLLEYFDKVGLTVRKDSSRTLTSGYENVLV